MMSPAGACPADYHPVHDMLRELQIPPYDFLRQHRLETRCAATGHGLPV